MKLRSLNTAHPFFTYRKTVSIVKLTKDNTHQISDIDSLQDQNNILMDVVIILIYNKIFISSI